MAKSNTKEGEVTFIEVDDKWWKKDSFKFCKFPKAFLMNPKYQALSHSAMLCYVTLFDRMSLSDHNGWIDKDGNVFIYYSNKELCKTMNCSHDTATKKLRELELFGLLRRKKQGQGKADVLYVLEPEEPCEKSAVKNAKESDSRVQESSCTGRSVLACNKNESNKKDFNKTNLSIRGWDEDEIREFIKYNIDYDILAERQIDSGELDGIVALMTDICCGTSATVFINGNNYPREMVVERFLKFNAHHIEYVMDTLRRTTSDIKNIRAYLLATLFNAPTTMENYWQQRVLHDMPQFALN